jgi:hypothetical protein
MTTRRITVASISTLTTRPSVSISTTTVLDERKGGGPRLCRCFAASGRFS